MTVVSRGVWGMPPPPQKNLNLRPFQLHFRLILTKNQSPYESLAVFEFFSAGEGDLVLGGSWEGHPRVPLF